MDVAGRVHLRIVDTDSVYPHEVADPGREKRIEERLRTEGILRDPLVVGAVPDVEGYVLLDGTNRKRALAALGLERLLVQVVDYADPHCVRLGTWCHATHRSMDELLHHVSDIPDVMADALPPLATTDQLARSTTVALILDREQRYALSHVPDKGVSRTDQLRHLVDLYEDTMTRVECSPDEIEERAHTMHGSDEGNTLIAFPMFTRSQVVSMAIGGALIPAGITRHIISRGRALRVNLPLEALKNNLPLEQSEARLQAHLQQTRPRFYDEPTVLFDS